MSTILMFAVPILTMRSFAEERRSKTDQMLLTAPVSIWKIVMGKFLAMAAVFLLPVLILCICPLIIKANGTAYPLVDYATIFAFFMYACCFIAVGMFISALTESQIIAAIGGYVAVFVIVMWSDIVYLIPSTPLASLVGFVLICLLVCLLLQMFMKNAVVTGGFGIISIGAFLIAYAADSTKFSGLLSQLLGKINFSGPLSNFGYYYIFDLSGILFYLSVIVICIVLTVQVIQKRRWS
jgi:ABC-2 type transport system permease protein